MVKRTFVALIIVLIISPNEKYALSLSLYIAFRFIEILYEEGFLYLFTFAVIILSLASCTATKYVPDGSYLLDEVKIHTDQKNVRPSSLRMYVRQNLMPNGSV